jgi:hypothetical protein
LRAERWESESERLAGAGGWTPDGQREPPGTTQVSDLGSHVSKDDGCIR